MDSNPQESDLELLGRIKSGQTQLFGEVYDRYSRQIYRYVYNRVPSKQVAEDVLSDVFFKALKAVDRARADHGSLAPWLYRIAANAVADHYRGRKPTVDLENAYSLDSGEDASQRARLSESEAQARRMLESLDDRQREIVIMRLWDDLSYKEITEIIGLKEGNCKVIFSRAMSVLRESYGPAALALIIISNIWTR